MESVLALGPRLHDPLTFGCPDRGTVQRDSKIRVATNNGKYVTNGRAQMYRVYCTTIHFFPSFNGEGFVTETLGHSAGTFIAVIAKRTV